MDVFTADPVSRLAFSLHENPGTYALLIGSGISRGANIQTGWEITLDLVRRFAALEGVEDQPDWEAWYVEREGREPDYSELIRALAPTQAERRAILHSYIEPTEEEREEGRKIPSEAHNAIAALVRSGHIRVVITTNFDRLLENALREEGIEPTVVSSADMLAGAEPLTHSSCYVLKLHGDYKDARILNTTDELGAYPEEYDRLLDRILDEFGLIVAGWSGQWDEALRGAILRAPNRRYPSYWAVRGSVSDEAEQLLKARAATAIPVESGDDFFKGLKARVETLDKGRKVHPLSLDLLRRSVKRYLPRPEHRIDLSDLVEDQLRSLLTQLETPELSTQGEWSVEEFNNRVRLYEEVSEPLVRVLGLMGRFGDGTETSNAHKCILSIRAEANKPMGGRTVWLNLRSYPAVLLYTAYGTALTEAGRLNHLRALFELPIPYRSGSSERLVNALHLDYWEGGSKDLWNELSKFKDNRYTPLSDHLAHKLESWSSDITGPVPSFETSYERFELLASLAQFDQASLQIMKEQFTGVNEQNPMMRLPMSIGRTGWHGQVARHLFVELEDSDVQKRLFAAGFAHGQPDALTFFRTNFIRLSSGMH